MGSRAVAHVAPGALAAGPDPQPEGDGVRRRVARALPRVRPAGQVRPARERRRRRRDRRVRRPDGPRRHPGVHRGRSGPPRRPVRRATAAEQAAAVGHHADGPGSAGAGPPPVGRDPERAEGPASARRPGRSSGTDRVRRSRGDRAGPRGVPRERGLPHGVARRLRRVAAADLPASLRRRHARPGDRLTGRDAQPGARSAPVHRRPDGPVRAASWGVGGVGGQRSRRAPGAARPVAWTPTGGRRRARRGCGRADVRRPAGGDRHRRRRLGAGPQRPGPRR